jgi:hypothetical protein
MNNFALLIIGVLALGSVTIAAVGLFRIRQAVNARGLNVWVPAYIRSRHRTPAPSSQQPLHLFIAVCDHYEPEWASPSTSVAMSRVEAWVTQYPKLFSQFADSRGKPPQHSFFFPQDHYQPQYLDALRGLCEAGYGDVEIHLHHDNDTADTLRQKLVEFRDTLFERHGLLRRDPVTNEVIYSFIHGNWALCNSRPDGRWCGVDHELPVLLQTGCYADFTMPSAPSDTQTPIINSIYYAADTPAGRCAHFSGPLARVGQAAPQDHLLLVQGPLLPDWNRKKFGFLPKIENGDLLGNHPPSGKRLPAWIEAGVCVVGQPNWRFIKLHTHGCKDGNLQMLLGEPMQRFHADLETYRTQHPEVQIHYVTAYEMAGLVHQAESGLSTPDWDALPHLSRRTGNQSTYQTQSAETR